MILSSSKHTLGFITRNHLLRQLIVIKRVEE